MIVLAALFFVVAIIYASVGFGGGSTYTALLAIAETDYRILPVVSLTCNIIVVTGGVIQFARAGAIDWMRTLPICALSIPLAWLGGRIVISEIFFTGLLAFSLFFAGLLLLFDSQLPPVGAKQTNYAASSKSVISARILRGREPVIGGAIGFLSGLVGIGGGIFLAPVLYLLRWGDARSIAGAASLFILVNSVAGILGHIQKMPGQVANIMTGHWWLFIAVILGGQIGSRLGVVLLPPLWMKRLTAILVLLVAARLLFHLEILIETHQGA